MASDPIVIDPPGFDQKAAWQECQNYVDKCGGLQHPDGETNWRAAFAADPGTCSCPACGVMYWAWGNIQKCTACDFKYPTDWWPMYSWGSQSVNKSNRYKHDERMAHPYYRHGFENPVDDPWKEHHKLEWQAAIRAKFGGTP